MNPASSAVLLKPSMRMSEHEQRGVPHLCLKACDFICGVKFMFYDKGIHHLGKPSPSILIQRLTCTVSGLLRWRTLLAAVVRSRGSMLDQMTGVWGTLKRMSWMAASISILHSHALCWPILFEPRWIITSAGGALLLRRLETILGRSCRERHLAHASEPRYSASRVGDNCVERPSPLPSWLSCLLRSKSSFQALLQWKYNGKTPSSNMFYTWIYAWASTLTVVALT